MLNMIFDLERLVKDNKNKYSKKDLIILSHCVDLYNR